MKLITTPSSNHRFLSFDNESLVSPKATQILKQVLYCNSNNITWIRKPQTNL